MSELGHNGGPPLQKLTSKRKIERIKEVLDMDISAAQKCIGIRIIADADTDGMTPELSTEDLKRSASVKDRETVYRATKRLDEKKVAKAFKEEGRPNRYLVLPSEAIDAVLDEIDMTGRVEPDYPHQEKPDGYGDVQPVGLNPTTPISFNPTGRVEPDGIGAQDARAHTPAHAGDNTSRATKESSSKIVSSPLSESERERDDLPAIRVNCSAIYGPNFTIDLGAVDIASGMAGIPLERGRQIAEICARDWAANSTKPQHPMAMIKRAISMDRNHKQIDEAKIASSTGKPEKGISRLKEKFLRAGE